MLLQGGHARGVQVRREWSAVTQVVRVVVVVVVVPDAHGHGEPMQELVQYCSSHHEARVDGAANNAA